MNEARCFEFMIPFQKPVLADRDWMEPLLLKANTKSADYSFVNLYAWAEYYQVTAARVADRILTRFTAGGKRVYSYPVGTGELRPAVDAILQDAAERGETPVIAGATEEMLAEISALYPETFDAVAYEDGFDYVYSAEKLATLGGKKLHGKRNHIRKFEAENPDWRFAPMTRADIPACRELSRHWLASLEGDTTQAEAEAKVLEICFEQMDALEMLGGVLYIGERLVGFTMASFVSPDTLDVHFEKAYWDVEGAYAMVNREFARLVQAQYPQVQWLNREDDMGLENLRRAKHSYYPELHLKKYGLTKRD